MNKDFKKAILKRLNEILLLITKANEKELDKIGIELLEIEKELLNYKTPREDPVSGEFL